MIIDKLGIMKFCDGILVKIPGSVAGIVTCEFLVKCDSLFCAVAKLA